MNTAPQRPPPPPLDPRRRVEDIGRHLASHGARVHFQPVVGHRAAAGPVALTCLVAATVGLLGLLAPLTAVAVLLALLMGAMRDVDGGQGWLRHLMPRRPGWVAEITLAVPTGTPAPGATTPTLLLWAPVAGRSPRRVGAPAVARLLLAIPALLGLVVLLGLPLVHSLAPPLGRAMVLGGSLGLALCGLLSPVLLWPGAPLPPAADPATWVLPLARRLSRRPLRGVRLVLAIGSEGSTWHDDLGEALRGRRHILDPERTVVLAVTPGRGPLAAVEREGIVVTRPAPAALVQALREADFPLTHGRTAAARARRSGFSAIGLLGTEHEAGRGPERLESALRSIARHLAPETP